MNAENTPQYWIAGANWSGEKKAGEFIEKGVWIMGWSQGDAPSRVADIKRMKPGDRIAMKTSVLAHAEIEILSIGVVKGVVLDADKAIAVVNWLQERNGKRVPHKGCTATLHGPFLADNPIYRDWLKEIFFL